MRLPRNRWFSQSEGKTWFRFGMYNGQAVEDVVRERKGRWYLNKMLADFEDLTVEVTKYLDIVLDTGADPFAEAVQKSEDDALLHKLFSPETSEVTASLATLKAKVEQKRRVRVEQSKAEKAAQEAKEVQEKRKNESEW